MGLIAEHGGALHGYETVRLPAAAGQPGRDGAAMLRRRSARTTRRAVLYLQYLADSFVPEDLASWYTERGFHFYVADLRPQAPACHRCRPAGLGDCLKALDAMSAYLRESEAIDTVVVSAHASGALIAALWCDARREDPPADALVLAAPAFGSGSRRRASRQLRNAGPAAGTSRDSGTVPAGQAGDRAVPAGRDGPVAGIGPGRAAGLAGPLAGAQRRLRSGLDIGCPVLVMCTAADWDARPAGRRGRTGRRRSGHGTIRLGPHVTWLQLADDLTGPLPPGAPGAAPFFRELGRWLGAYLSGQFRDQLL